MDQRERNIILVCDEAVKRLRSRLGHAEVGCLFRFGDVLRHVAHTGRLHLIYEIPSDQGGVAWRAARQAEIQLVEDVTSDPDYLAADETVRSEISAPVQAGQRGVVAVLDVEFPDRVFAESDIEAVRNEAEHLGRELEPYVS